MSMTQSKHSLLLLAACCASVLATGPVRAQEKATTPQPAQAQTIVQQAQTASQKQNKAVMVMFHASWCGWCKRLEAVMSRPEFKKMFEANYVMVSLDVMENGPKVAQLENPGGKEIMAQLGGQKSGLPFYAWTDAKGKKLADSNAMPKNANIGYPGEPDEIETFVGLIKQTAPNWSAQDLKSLHDYLVANAPKATGTAAH